MIFIFSLSLMLLLLDAIFLSLFNLLYHRIWKFERHGISAGKVLRHHALLTGACQVSFALLVLLADANVNIGARRSELALQLLLLSSIFIPLTLLFLKHRQLLIHHQ